MTSGVLSEESGCSVVLSISGMTCSGCVGSVTRLLTKVPGVSGAEVDFASRRAFVLGTASPQKLIEAVQAAGYDAELSPGETGD